MRSRALLAAFAAGSLSAAAVLLNAGAANASSWNYAALGDSYSSGLGAGNYYSTSGSCYRSASAYSVDWTNANAPSSFNFAACSGAKTTDVVNTQAPTLNSATSLVSITIGGNDVGFSTVMEDCVLYSTSTCVSEIDAAEVKIANDLPGELDNAFNAIRSHAPNARVVVLDYPEFYDLAYSSTCVGLSTTDRTAINGAADQIDSAIQSAAGRANDVFKDVRGAFTGHEICDSNSWLHSTDWFDLTDSYHPTASGQQYAYYPTFAAGV